MITEIKYNEEFYILLHDMKHKKEYIYNQYLRISWLWVRPFLLRSTDKLISIWQFDYEKPSNSTDKTFLLITKLTTKNHVFSQSEDLLQWLYHKFHRFTRDEHLSVFSCERVAVLITLIYDCTRWLGERYVKSLWYGINHILLLKTSFKFLMGRNKLSAIKFLVVLNVKFILITFDLIDRQWLHNWFEQ